MSLLINSDRVGARRAMSAFEREDCVMNDERKIHRGNAGDIVERDTERFKLLFTNSRPQMPPGYCAPLDMRNTRQLIGERLRGLRASSNAHRANTLELNDN